VPQSPELAGGEGFTFEGAVGALYLTHLLAEGYAPGIEDRTVCRVAFQQRDFGEPLDDVIIDFKSSNGELARLSLQVKRSLIISKARSNTDFREIVRDCWATLAKTNFRHHADRFGAAVGEVARGKARALATLCELARESVLVDHFEARFAPGGNASAEIKDVREEVATLLSEITGTLCTNAEVHQFLAHFVLIEFDFLHAGADDPPQAVTRVRDCLAPTDAAKAPLVWSRLIELARASAGKSGVFDRARLVRSISQVASLRIATSLRSDLDKLTALARGYVDDIQDDVGGTRVERTSVSAELDAKLANSRLIQIRGLPGSGKSVLLRQRVQRAIDHGPVFFLKADQLEGRSWISFASTHGFSSATLNDVLVEIGATGSAVLFIDAIDRVEKEHQPVILEVLRTVIRSPLLDNWRIVVSLRDTGIEPLRNWMGELLDAAGVATVTVNALNDDEAKKLAEAKPHLSGLLFGPSQVREIVRRPFFAKILNQSFIVEVDQPPFEPHSEVDLIDNWWSRGGYDAAGQNAIERQRALVELAGLRARHLSEPISLGGLTPSSVALIDQLVVDGILQHSRRGHTVRFSHDIFFEWALFHVLADRGEDWLQEIRACGEPPAVARAVELLSQWEYARGQDWATHLVRAASSQMRSQWTRAWLLGPLAAPNFASDESQFANAAFANDFRFLKRALVWFQAEKTTPNPNILAGSAENLPQGQRVRFADRLGWPSDFRAWQRFIAFLIRHVSDIPVSLYPDVLSIFEVWQNALADLRNPCSRSIVTQCAEWLRDVDAVSVAEEPNANSARWAGARDLGDFRKALSSLILRASRSEPNFAEEYLNRSISSRRIREDTFEEIVAFSPTLALSHPQLLVELALKHLKEELPDDRVERERRESLRAARLRQRALAKPQAKRTREDNIAISGAFSAIGSYQFSFHDWEALSVDRDTHNFWPPSPLREPFHSLFRGSSPVEALRLLRELCNHAITAWRQLHRHARDGAGTPVPLEIAFPWGTQAFWGSDREYLWCRAVWAPKPIACGFMALEEWCFRELERGRPVADLIQRVVEGNECIGILGVAASLAQHSEALSEAIFPLITSQRLLQADLDRMVHDLSSSFVNLMGFTGRSDQSHVEAIRSSNAREIRKKQLAWLVPRYVIGGEEFAERTRTAILNFKNHLPFQYEEQRNLETVRKLLTAQALEYAELADLENYRAYKTEVPDQVAIVHVSPSASQPERVEKVEQARQSLNTSHVWTWASKAFETGSLSEAFTVASATALAKEIDSETLFETSADGEDIGMRRGAVAAVAAIALNFREGNEPDLAWARDVLKRAIKTPEKHDAMWTSGAVIPWHQAIFVARGLGADLRGGTAEKGTVFALLDLVTHPLEVVSLAALDQACRLWPTDPKITWAALILAFALCHIQSRPPGNPRRLNKAIHLPNEVRGALDVAESFYRQGEGWPSLPPPPAAWMRLDPIQAQEIRYHHEDYDTDDAASPGEIWSEPDVFWYSEYAAKILPILPLRGILESEAKDTFLGFVSSLLLWTNQKNAPPWVKPGKRGRGSSRLFRWTHELGRTLGQMSGLLSVLEVQSRFLDPILALEDDACWSLLSPLANAYVCVYVYDAQIVPNDAVSVLDLCLTRLLASTELRRTSYRSGKFSGFDQPLLAETLMFVSVEHAALAVRYVNGDWSEIDRILPLIDRFVRFGGWAASVMGLFLTLCERAKASYPAEEFADQILAVTHDTAGELRGWHGGFIPARIAGLVQHFADQDSRMSLPLAQKFLRILDQLVDMGDRRSAALQLGEAFREVRVAA
jgi:hypothetical protein